MKRHRASYANAIDWIARNDDPGSKDAFNPAALQGMITVLLVADIWRSDAARVAGHVVARRHQIFAEAAAAKAAAC